MAKSVQTAFEALMDALQSQRRLQAAAAAQRGQQAGVSPSGGVGGGGKEGEEWWGGALEGIAADLLKQGEKWGAGRGWCVLLVCFMCGNTSAAIQHVGEGR